MTRQTRQRPPVRKWTEEDDQVLIDEIGKNPLSMKQCFLAASERLGRTPGACAARWYSYLSNSTAVKHTAVLTLGRYTAVRNKKRMTPRVYLFSILRNTWDSIIRLIFGNADYVER